MSNGACPKYQGINSDLRRERANSKVCLLCDSKDHTGLVSHILVNLQIAQLVERLTFNQYAVGSIPTPHLKRKSGYRCNDEVP